MSRIVSCTTSIALFFSIAMAATIAPAPVSDDQYIAAFNQHFQKRNTPAALGDIASAQIYDSIFMGDPLDKAMASLTNNDGIVPSISNTIPPSARKPSHRF